MSKAQAGLAQLDSLNQDVKEAAELQAAADRVRSDPGNQVQPETDEEGNAKFGTFEAIAMGVLATAILGPVGGLLIGGATGMLQRKEEQGILDRLASEKNALTESVDIHQAQLDEFKVDASPEELKEIAAMEGKLTAGMGWSTSASPDLKKAGIASLASMQNDIMAYADKQETQKIAFDANEARLKVELGDKQYNRYSNMKKDYTAESQPYTEAMRFGDMTLRAIESGTPAQIYTAMIGFNKTIDPNSAVLGEERDALSSTGGYVDRGFQMFMEMWDGTPSTSQQRRELADATMNTLGAVQRQQDIREVDYAQRLEQDNFSPDYYDDFMLSQKQNIYVPTIEPDAMEVAWKLDQAARAKQSAAIGDTLDAVRKAGTDFETYMNNAQDERSIVIGDTIDNMRKGIPNAMENASRYIRSLGGFAAGGNRPQNN